MEPLEPAEGLVVASETRPSMQSQGDQKNNLAEQGG